MRLLDKRLRMAAKRRKRSRLDDHVIVDAALGAVAGVLATWLMGRVTTYMYEHEDEQARQREDAARGGKTAYVIAAERAAGLVGVQLDEDQEKRLGSALHWTVGATMGAAYAVARKRIPGIDAALGTAFGAGFFLLFDEGANTALRLTPPPNQFPWQAHARGLAGHVAYGATTELALKAADELLH